MDDNGNVVAHGASIEAMHIKGVNDTEARSLRQEFVDAGKKTSETPRVNVNELDLVGVKTKWDVYGHTRVSPYGQLLNMINNIHAKEVVIQEDDDKVSGGKDTYVYPVKAESISDQREEEAQGESVVFSLSDELKSLYRKHNASADEGKELESLLDEVIASLTGSVSMSYDLYGQEDSTCGKIVVEIVEIANEYDMIEELAKQIEGLQANGGEEERINALNEKIQETRGRIAIIRENLGKDGHDADINAIENYTLQVKFSPNYAAVPVGQGGDPALNMDGKFHTGSFGTGYQGHAAGTDESNNVHVIKPCVKKVWIIKTDESGIHGNALAGAQFTLYKKPGNGDDEVVKEYTMDTGSSLVVEAPRGVETETDGKENYYLIDAKVLAGFIPLSDPVDIDVELTGDPVYLDGFAGVYNLKQDAIVKLGDYALYSREDVAHLLRGDESEIDIEDGVCFVIANERGMTLPESSGIGTLPFRLAGFTVSAMAGACLLRKHCK